MQHLWTRFIAMLSQATHQAKMRAIYQLIGLDQMWQLMLPLDLHGRSHVVHYIHSLILGLSVLKNPKHELG